jgi:hypothetical protein
MFFKLCSLVGRDVVGVGRYWILTVGLRSARGRGGGVASRVCGWFALCGSP